ncbi:MFS transporter [Candidimonas sp. SYP-B2681]|uniref:CynX/NimT family MFS transporter n=1 Tax=Candidimonas sp. SYP-B2681 TaxID=2497686 RepID=UPI000F868216|nr:MFS transporter [Candidimonas sp. SYP-B2681]RTZ40024.1 MFS transporter [Candidimonas sp. SYP-B2681]
MIPAENCAEKAPITSAKKRLAGQLLLGLSLMLIAFNLRPVFPSLSVLLPEVIRQTNLSSSGAGYLTTLPVLCLGLFAPFAPRLARRIGPERTLLIALVFLTAGTALRGVGDIYSLFAGTAMAGGAIAIGNVLLPSVVKRDFPKHAALMTGLYTMALCGGAASAAAFTLPVSDLFNGSLSVGLAFWAVPAALVALIWAPLALRSAPGPGRAAHRPGGLWRDPLAWNVTFFMGLQSALAYCLMGWLAPILRDRGLDGLTTGLIVSVSIMVQVVTCLLVPPLAVRCKDQRIFNVVLAVIAATALLGLLFAPLSTVWAWAILQGIGQGGLFAIAMTVIVLRSPDPMVAAQLSGMAQGIGYLLAASGPLLIGLLHGITGGYSASGWVFAALGLGVAASGWQAGRAAYVRPHRRS